jgi:hypothetical protein
MMGRRQVDQAALFYEFSLERHVPATHLLRSNDRFVDLSEVRGHLAPFYSPRRQRKAMMSRQVFSLARRRRRSTAPQASSDALAAAAFERVEKRRR